jgi:8-amino-7-oxononanoate synthase
MTADLKRGLADLDAQGRLRQLAPRKGLDFSSNDYLGLAESPELAASVVEALSRGVPIGAGGSRLLRGNHPEHEALELEAAAYFGSEAALYFATGFAANYAIFSTLPQRGDIVVYDELIHASAHDGMRNGRGDTVAVRHNDAGAFEKAIVVWRASGGRGRPWLVVESIYSMDGDRAPIDDLVGIARRHDGMLVIDEAHATGVLGPDGRGLGAAYEGAADVISLHTCGKALGASGALVCGPRVICDFLVNRGRAFVFSTAPSPLSASAVRAALRICRDEPQRRQQHADLVALATREFAQCCGIAGSGSHILPVLIGADRDAVDVAAFVQSHGFDVRAVRPPTVPEGTARLRIAITLNVGPDDVSRLARVVGRALTAHSGGR